MSQHHQVAAALLDIEAALRQLSLWQSEPPPEDALRSEQPFAVDSLSFEQWLQFIFLPRMHFLIDHNQPLPAACSIAPMAEESFKGRRLPLAQLLKALQEVDALISGE